jgi:hypothetical protein
MFEKLVRLDGGHYQIHDDFYDKEAGAALQGIYERVTGTSLIPQ